jgi:ABC-2 type transport system ATP-binding protein
MRTQSDWNGNSYRYNSQAIDGAGDRDRTGDILVCPIFCTSEIDECRAVIFAQHIAALKGLDLAAADQQFLTLIEAIGLHADIRFKISTFSGGMRRLIFAQSLLGNPELIELDEPTADLDRDTARRAGQLVLHCAQTAIVVMTIHLSDELAPHAHAILRVDQGKLTQS